LFKWEKDGGNSELKKRGGKEKKKKKKRGKKGLFCLYPEERWRKNKGDLQREEGTRYLARGSRRSKNLTLAGEKVQLAI